MKKDTLVRAHICNVLWMVLKTHDDIVCCGSEP
jgi:hypothetical protein